MTMISKKKVVKENAKILVSIARAIEDAGNLLSSKVVTGYMLILNFDEQIQENDKIDTVKSYSLYTLGDIRKLLENAEYGVARAALRVRRELLNKDRRYH